MKHGRTVFAVSAAIGIALATAPSAQAAFTDTGEKWTSCSATETTALRTLQHTGGTLSIKRTSASNGIVSAVWATSSAGVSLSGKNISTNGTAQWSAGPDWWTFKTHPAASKDCNGVLPGNGVTLFQWSIQYN